MPTDSPKPRLFFFPPQIHPIAARSVAFQVAVSAVVILLFNLPWLLPLLTYGFVARALLGPRYSPMARLASGIVAPLADRRATKRGDRPYRNEPGPSKRFAQGIGLVFSGFAMAAWLFALPAVAWQAPLGILFVFASLEAGLGFCAGCWVFGYLMRWGVIPADTCMRCRRINPGA